MNFGIRPQDAKAFAEAAQRFQVWLLVRETNRASWKYIGIPNYFPKPITCKAKTADLDAFASAGVPRKRYDTGGLVVDPTVHQNAFAGYKLTTALGLWDDFKSAHFASQKGDYAVDRDPKSHHYGCVTYKGKYLHADYDLYDIIVVGHERANLAILGHRDGVPDFRPARLFPIEDFVNSRIGAEMVHHGGQFQYSGHTNDIVDIFGPNGETLAHQIAAPWYALHFPNRRVPGPAGGFAARQKPA